VKSSGLGDYARTGEGERNMGEKALRTVTASLLLGLWPFAASAFHLQEATIADIHRAILAKELTATKLVGLYLK
jgi:hypothetical protein